MDRRRSNDRTSHAGNPILKPYEEGMTNAEMKGLLVMAGIDFSDCVEKSDLVARYKEAAAAEDGSSDTAQIFDGGNKAMDSEPAGECRSTSTSVMKYGCAHYRRRCRLVAPCCGEIFTCRHCHNEVKFEGEREVNKAHELDRTQVQEVVCAICDLRQPVASHCSRCQEEFGQYFCEKCRFYDDDTSKGQFHCDGCGLCRVGGPENYFHCVKCVACLPLQMMNNHKCLSESLHSNCPVCLEFMHSSLRSATILGCGHAMHSDCQRQLLRSSARCPICNVSMLDMADQWRELDGAIAETPMPPEYRDMMVTILCNDCLETTSAHFHVLGIKCASCGSYNTKRSARREETNVNQNSSQVGGGTENGFEQHGEDDAFDIDE